MEMFAESYTFLSKYRWIHNFQVTDIFKQDVCSNIPDDWCACLSQLSIQELNEVPFLEQTSKSKYPGWPDSLHDFLAEASRLSAERNQGLQGSQDKAIEINHDMSRGMNCKKRHEVARMASLISDIATDMDCDVIIDVGSGLGYLDHVLHQRYGLKVLGLETVQSHVSGAERRAVKQGISCRAVRSQQCHIENTEDSYKDFVAMIESIYPTLECDCVKSEGCACKGPRDIPRICLIGLHCCGDLSPTILSYFSSCADVKTVCCVGCCYHKMVYSGGRFTKFPISHLGKSIFSQCPLNDGQPFITPCTLRLGAQETRCRWQQQSESDHQSHINHVAFRGLLSLTDEDDRHIRQTVRRCDFTSMQTFVDTYYGLENSPYNADKKSRLMSLHDQHKKHFETIEILTLLQVIVQPVIEAWLLHDRVQWLQEQGHSSARTQPVFDEAISPRNLALVATKPIQ